MHPRKLTGTPTEETLSGAEYYHIGMAYFQERKFQLAEIYLKIAYDFFLDPQHRTLIENRLGICHYENMLNDSGMNIMQNNPKAALDILEPIPYDTLPQNLTLRILSDMGICHFKLRQYNQALSCHEKVLSLLGDTTPSSSHFLSSFVIGLSLTAKGQIQRGLLFIGNVKNFLEASILSESDIRACVQIIGVLFNRSNSPTLNQISSPEELLSQVDTLANIMAPVSQTYTSKMFDNQDHNDQNKSPSKRRSPSPKC